MTIHAAPSGMPAASTLALHQHAMANKPCMEAVLRGRIHELEDNQMTTTPTPQSARVSTLIDMRRREWKIMHTALQLVVQEAEKAAAEGDAPPAVLERIAELARNATPQEFWT